MLSFQKPGPLIFEWVATAISIRERSVFYPVCILGDIMLHIRL